MPDKLYETVRHQIMPRMGGIEHSADKVEDVKELLYKQNTPEVKEILANLRYDPSLAVQVCLRRLAVENARGMLAVPHDPDVKHGGAQAQHHVYRKKMKDAAESFAAAKRSGKQAPQQQQREAAEAKAADAPAPPLTGVHPKEAVKQHQARHPQEDAEEEAPTPPLAPAPAPTDATADAADAAKKPATTTKPDPDSTKEQATVTCRGVGASDTTTTVAGTQGTTGEKRKRGKPASRRIADRAMTHGQWMEECRRRRQQHLNG